MFIECKHGGVIHKDINLFAGRAVKRERRKGSSRRQQPAYGAAVNEVARELRLYDKSAKDKSANDTSAKPTVRMPTVRKGQQCEETRVRMSIVRMPAVRCDIGAKKVRQQCE